MKAKNINASHQSTAEEVFRLRSVPWISQTRQGWITHFRLANLNDSKAKESAPRLVEEAIRNGDLIPE